MPQQQRKVSPFQSGLERGLGGLAYGVGYNLTRAAADKGFETPLAGRIPIGRDSQPYDLSHPGARYEAEVDSHLLPGDSGAKTKDFIEKQIITSPEVQRLFAAKKITPENIKFQHKIYRDATGQPVIRTKVLFCCSCYNELFDYIK
jgi:hypothetical protein